MEYVRQDLTSAWHAFCRGERISWAEVPAREALASAVAVDRSLGAAILLSLYLGERRWTEARALIASAGDSPQREVVGKELKAILDLRDEIELDPVLPALTEVLREKSNPHVARESACRAITRIARGGGNISSEKALLEECLRERNKTIKAAAAEALALLALEDHRPEDWLALLRHDSGPVRSGALRALAAGKSEVRRQVAPALSALKITHQSSPDSTGVAHAVVRLLEALPTPDDRRSFARLVLESAGSDFGPPKSAWSEMLDECRRTAEELADNTQIDALAQALRTGSQEHRIKAVRRIAYSQDRGLHVEPLLADLARLIHDPDDEMARIAARVCASEWARTANWEAFRGVLLDPDEAASLRMIGAAWIVGLADRADLTAIVPVLVEFARGKGERREQARTALSGLTLTGATRVDEWLELRGQDLFAEQAADRDAARTDLAAAAVLGHPLPEGARLRLHEERVLNARRNSGFPEFPDPTPLGEGLSWTAQYDSWDQYHDDIYYMISLYRKGQEWKRFFVKLPYAGNNEDPQLGPALHECARAGQPNTEYRGAVFDTVSGAYSDLA